MDESKKNTVSVPESLKPFSLQHWALLSALKNALRTCTAYGGLVMLDIHLFNQLKSLHRRGVKLLDYEFAIDDYGIFQVRVPLHKLISKWELRYHGTTEQFFEPNLYCTRIVSNIDSLAPFCACRIPVRENINISMSTVDDRMDQHTNQCDRDCCRIAPTSGCDLGCNINIAAGHTLHCNREEFRYV